MFKVVLKILKKRTNENVHAKIVIYVLTWNYILVIYHIIFVRFFLCNKINDKVQKTNLFVNFLGRWVNSSVSKTQPYHLKLSFSLSIWQTNIVFIENNDN